MSLLAAIHRAVSGAPDVEAVVETALEPEANASIDPPAATADIKEPVMSEQQTTTGGANQPDQNAIAAARAEGAGNERARIKAIVNHAEADGRGKLAAHLAFETDMSAEAAGAMMAAAPKEAAAAPPQTDAQTYEASRTGAEGLAQPGARNDKKAGLATLSASVDRVNKRR